LSEKIAGISYGRLRERADVKRVDGIDARICSLADLVALKRAAGRERDIADLSDLEAAHGDLPTAGS
jgi:predicted nucleotidyltransferase